MHYTLLTRVFMIRYVEHSLSIQLCYFYHVLESVFWLRFCILSRYVVFKIVCVSLFLLPIRAVM